MKKLLLLFPQYIGFTIIISLSTPSVFSTTPEQNLIKIAKINPAIKTQIYYATDQNFTGQVIYTSSKCYVRKGVAQALDAVQKELAAKKLGLKIWDGYRPVVAQQKLWDVCAKQYPNEKERENYVGNPKKGGRHTRGTAVDVTLIDLETGKELPMPTKFDHFGPEAWRSYDKLPQEVKNNRTLLEEVMTKHGFKGLESEWWHFDFNGWEKCPVLNIDFEELD